MRANLPLRRFLQTYLTNPKINPPKDCLRQYWYGSSLILFREGQFQVELVTVKPSVYVPTHMHPNADTYERFISLGKEGNVWEAGRKMTALDLATKPQRYSGFIPAGVPHGAFTGDGAAFLSVQQWLNNVPPTFLADDWVLFDPC